MPDRVFGIYKKEIAMNTFDFYSFQIESHSIRELTKAGINRGDIQTIKDGYKRYGSRCFPIWRHIVSVDFMDVTTSSSDLVNDRIQSLQKKYGLKVCAKYITRD